MDYWGNNLTQVYEFDHPIVFYLFFFSSDLSSPSNLFSTS